MAIREARWDCQYCGTRAILGRLNECPKCGRPRPEGAKFYLAEGAAEATDAALLAQAGVGPDWICSFCTSSNPAGAAVCQNCGAAREATSQVQLVKEYAPGQAPSSGDMTLDAPAESPAAPARPRLSRQATLAIGLGGLALLALFAFVFLGRGRDVSAEVSGFRWRREVAVEELRPVRAESFDLPPAASLIEQRQAIQRYDQVLAGYETEVRQAPEQVQVGEREYVCGQRDLGNGFFEDVICSEPVYETRYRSESVQVPIYQQVPVYGTLFVYEAEEWHLARSETAEGSDHSPYWPRSDLEEGQREGQRSESYVALFEDATGREYELALPLAEWQALEVGRPVELIREPGGQVVGIQ
ncbi:MAG: zinc ribbon domain-containing protein [Candidatus Promineifilaceae bacterium]